MKVKGLKKAIKKQGKDLGVVIKLDRKPEFKIGLYRKGEVITEGRLKALADKHVPVWADFTDTDCQPRRGIFEVVSTPSECVMLEDGSCFALDFQFTGNDDAPCQDTDEYDGGDMAIYEAIRKQRK